MGNFWRFTPHPGYNMLKVELGVILGMLGLLGALFVYSAFFTARYAEPGRRQANCTSNQKQIAQAVLQYASEHEETLPGKLGATDASWATMIDIDSRLLDCKSVGNPGNRDYGYNAALYGMPASCVPLPSRTILTADSDAGTALLNTGSIARRHTRGFIASFMDSHVAYSKTLSTQLPLSATADNPWILQGASNVVTVDATGACTFNAGSTLTAHDYIAVTFLGAASSCVKILGEIRRPPAGQGPVIVVPCGAGVLRWGKNGDITVR